MSDTVANNVVVGISYELKLDNGEVIDFTEDDDTLEYLHGHMNIIPGLENELVGLKVGDKKDVVVKPADGYGEHDPDGLQEYPRDEFPEDMELSPGTMLMVRDTESGDVSEAVVKEVGDDMVKMDFNHPLAGQTLHFSVTVASLRAASDEELAHGHVHDGGHHH